MQLGLCSQITFLFLYLFSRLTSREEEFMEAVNTESPFRKCANIKSKRHPDVQCSNIAIDGDFCARHCKRPHRYVASTESRIAYTTRQYSTSIRKIQKWWRFRYGFYSVRKQGPGLYTRAIAQNETEVYSMEPIVRIPKLYFFSYKDAQNYIWAFDIRSLSHSLNEGKSLANPYTREAFAQSTIQKVRERIAFLRKRKYPILYLSAGEDALSPEQIWNQKVLDVFMKLEALGYSAACAWFNSLTLEDHHDFYRGIYELWDYRLGLSSMEKESIVPFYSRGQQRLFRNIPEIVVRENHNLKWWQKQNLNLILNMITRSMDKTRQALGATYVIMGLVQVSEDAAEAYPWVAETLEN